MPAMEYRLTEEEFRDTLINTSDATSIRNALKPLRILFNAIGLVTTKNATNLRKFLMISIAIVQWCIWLIMLEYGIFGMSSGESHKIEFNVIGVLMWVLYSCMSYSLLAYNSLRNREALTFLCSMSCGESNPFALRVSLHTRNANVERMHHLVTSAIITIFILVVANLTYSFLTFGPLNLVAEFLPLAKNSVLALFILPFLVIANLVTPIPMVIVHISSYFTEKRIEDMVRYLEVKRPTDIDVIALMNWYDELYEFNRKLSRYVHTIVTSAILTMLPLAVFLLQV